MVRVHRRPVLAVEQAINAFVEVVELDAVMESVAAGRPDQQRQKRQPSRRFAITMRWIWLVPS